MSDWVAITVDVVENGMPTDLATLHTQWVQAHPEKAERLREVTEETVGIIRCAVEGNPANLADPDVTKVPMVAFRHALNAILFNLGMEMGVQFSAEVYSLYVRSDIWLREVQRGSIRVRADGLDPWPSYFAPDPSRRWV